jgi:hypothetical protein
MERGNVINFVPVAYKITVPIQYFENEFMLLVAILFFSYTSAFIPARLSICLNIQVPRTGLPEIDRMLIYMIYRSNISPAVRNRFQSFSLRLFENVIR